MKIIVTNSPWPTRIPNGTVIVETPPREGHTGNWFKLPDGSNPFEDDKKSTDGKFKLFKNEYEVIE